MVDALIMVVAMASHGSCPEKGLCVCDGSRS